jgi:hypothetical protein
VENNKKIYVNEALKRVFDLLSATYKVELIAKDWLDKETYLRRTLHEEFDVYEGNKISYSYEERGLILFADKYFLIAFGMATGSSRASAEDIYQYESHILAIPLGISEADLTTNVFINDQLKTMALREHILKIRENYFKKPIGHEILSCLPTVDIMFLQTKYGGQYLVAKDNNFENVLLPLLRGVAEENLKKL